MVEYYKLMNENGKMRLFQEWGGGIKENDGGRELNYDK
jgi:hypothetical protein